MSDGGTFVTSFFSGFVDDHDLVILGGSPGRLRDILGIWLEEEDALPPGVEIRFEYNGKRYPARLLCDLSHPESNTLYVLSRYEEDFYAGMPVITKNEFGKGSAYYVAARSDKAFYRDFMSAICAEAGIASVAEPQEGLEATIRFNENGRFLFLLNHSENELETALEDAGVDLITGREYKRGEKVILKAKDTAIIKQSENRI